jgi:hypothetical protein
MKISKKQLRIELNYCLLEQGMCWYYSKEDLYALTILGLFDLHQEDLKRILRNEERKNA